MVVVACARGERRVAPIMRDIRDGLVVVVWVAGARDDLRRGMVICTDARSAVVLEKSRYNLQLVDAVFWV